MNDLAVLAATEFGIVAAVVIGALVVGIRSVGLKELFQI